MTLKEVVDRKIPFFSFICSKTGNKRIFALKNRPWYSYDVPEAIELTDSNSLVIFKYNQLDIKVKEVHIRFLEVG